MKYNLAEQSYLSVTSSGIGNVFINGPDINNLLIDPGTSVVTVSGSNDDILVIDCDLTRRTEIEEVRYYFFSDTASGIVASGIEFQYKNNFPESYTTITTNTDNGYYYYATIPESPSVPRYLRLIHTLSGTAISGTVNCFYVVNDDTQVDFGTDGSLTQKNIIGSYDTTTTVTIPIYNDGSTKSDMYTMLEATGTAIDDLISISDSESGAYYGPSINADSVAGPSNWNGGTFVNTRVNTSNKVELYGGAVATRFDPSNISPLAELCNDNYTCSGTDPVPSLMYSMGRSLIGVSEGKWYFEVELTGFYSGHDYFEIGICNSDLLIRDVVRGGALKDLPIGGTLGLTGGPANGWSVDGSGYKVHNATSTAWLGSFAEGYVVRIALDLDTGPNGKVWFGKNDNEWPNSAVPEDGTFVAFDNLTLGDTYYIVVATYEATAYMSINKTLSYPNRLPTGFKPLISYFDEGTYTTKISKNTDEIKRYNIKSSTPSNTMITTVSGNAYEVIEVREHGTKPINYAYYTIFDPIPPSTAAPKLVDYWVYDQSLKEEHTEDIVGVPSITSPYYPSVGKYVFIDNVTGITYGTYRFYPYSYNYYGTYTVYQHSEEDHTVTTFVINSSAGTYGSSLIDVDTYWMGSDSSKGIWFYCYSSYEKAGMPITATGYYLFRLDSAMVVTLKIYSSTDTYVDKLFSVDYDNDRLWVYDTSQSSLIKLDSIGTVVLSVTAETVYALVDDGSGGLWYIGELTLKHINSVGDELASFSTGNIQYADVKIADDDTLWVISTNYVRNVYKSDGRLNFLVNIVNASKLHSVKSGVYVETSTSKYHYLDKDERVVKFTLDDFEYQYGFMDEEVGGSTLFEKYFPTTVDPIWNTLAWKEVNYYKYMLDASYMYYQLRMTLQPSLDKLTSPEVEYVYMQKGLKLNDVPVENYRNIYFKVNSTTQSNIGTYTPKLLAWREELV